MQHNHRSTSRPDLGGGQSERRKCILRCITAGCQSRGSQMRTNRIIVITFILIASGCNKHVPTTALPPVAPPNPVAVELDDADRAFNAGSYDEAARGYESYLKADTSRTRRDEALFRMGLAYALRPTADWQRASSAF